MRWWVLAALCGCRFGFDPRADSGTTGDIAADAAAMTITFGERPSSQRQGVTRDTTVDQSTPSANYGRADDLSVAEFAANGEHSLLRFELSSIAAGTSVVEARLQLARLDYGDETPGSIEVRLLGESWVEGTNNGTPGTGANWTTRDGTTAWLMAGGTTTRTLTSVTPAAPELVIVLDTAVVQDWIDNPATNDGLLLTVTPNTAHYHLHARDSTLDLTARPELALDLVP